MDEHTLQVIPLVEGRQVIVSALAVDGHSEVYEFLRETLRTDQHLYADVRRILLFCADNFHHAPAMWLRAIRTWEDHWELRKGDHRLLGFLRGRELVLCLHRVKSGPSLPRQDFERVARLRQEWISQDE